MSKTAKLQKLLFKIGVLDVASGPIDRLQNKLKKLTNHSQDAMRKVAWGGGFAAASFYSLGKALDPARKMFAATGELASLDTPIKELDRMQNMALFASTKYGTAADKFMQAGYDIQSAVGVNIDDGQLSIITDRMNTLAVATKGQVGEMGNLFSTLAGVFEDRAVTMGMDNFSLEVAALTAKTVKLNKTTGAQMERAFRGIGSFGIAQGVGIEEQYAVLGSLQKAMPGAEAGTKYKAFLNGVVKAQAKLGLQFTDSQGRMLPIIDILEKIKGRYGEVKGNALAMAEITKAFGSTEASLVVADLVGKIDPLRNQLTDLKDATYEQVVQMAETIADPWDKAGLSIVAVTTKLGGLLLPKTNEFMDAVAKVSQRVLYWIDQNQALAGILTQVFMWTGGVIVAVAALTMIYGLAKLAAIGFGIVLAGLKKLLFLWRIAALVSIGVSWLLQGAFLALGWPIHAIVAALAALAIGAVALWWYWDDLMTAIGKTEAWQALVNFIAVARAELSAWADLLGSGFKSAFEAVMNWLQDKIAWLRDTLKWLGDGLASIGLKSDKATLRMDISEFGGGAADYAGGRAMGGLVRAGALYRINERLPEMLIRGSNTYLLNDRPGRVEPLERIHSHRALNHIIPFPTPKTGRIRQAAERVGGMRPLTKITQAFLQPETPHLDWPEQAGQVVQPLRDLIRPDRASIERPKINLSQLVQRASSGAATRHEDRSVHIEQLVWQIPDRQTAEDMLAELEMLA